MRNSLFSLFLVLIASHCLHAQEPGNALLLQSGTVYPGGNLEEFIQSTISPAELVDGYYYRIVQFNNYPNDKLKDLIKKSGLILNMYLPYKSYSVAIPQNFDKNFLRLLDVHSILSWSSENKTSLKLLGNEFPRYTLTKEGSADLIVHYHQNIHIERILELMQEGGIVVIDRLEAIHTITVRIPVDKKQYLLELPFVYYIEPIAPPSSKDDTEARSLHRSNVINSDFFTGRHYDGDGVTIGLADDGEIGPHIDFTGRIAQHLTGLGGNHGDMTSGICIGAGNLDPRFRGMATGAFLHVYSISSYPHIVNAVSNFNSLGTVITSTSYSQGCNEYTSTSQFGDQTIYDNPQLEFVFSAGNDGTSNCNYGAGALWGNITGGYKVGKNVIAVGNLNSSDALETSSSRGPAPDGRIKPDICSNGYNQMSTDEANTYQVGGGTSAACPGVAGVLAQLYQAYKSITGLSNPPSALMKACVLNSAEDLGNRGPDFKHGWGRINAFRALTTIEDHRYIEDSVVQSQSNLHTILVPPGVLQMRVMVYWHDVGGTPAAAKSLVNDLNMTVTDPSMTTYLPWVLNPQPNAATLNALPVRGIDSLNNVEQVTIDNPSAGSYDISIDGTQIPLGIQKYYIVYEFRTDSIFVTYPNGGEGLVPATSEYLRWDAYDTSGTFTIEYSTNAGNTWTLIANGIPGNERQYGWGIAPSISGDRGLIRISRGGISDVSDTLFTIIRRPSNFRIRFSCPDSIGLAWDSVPNASGYVVSMLGNKYMDDIATTTAKTYTVTGTNALSDYWFSVKAIGPNGGLGRRTNAINNPPGVRNCLLAIDGGIINITNPTNGLQTDCQDLSNISIQVELSNTGIAAVGNFDMHYAFDTGAVVTETFTGSITTGNSSAFTFSQPISIATAGNHEIKVWLTIPGDQNSFNDTAVIQLSVLHSDGATTPFIETFDSIATCSTVSDCEQNVCSLGSKWINVGNVDYDDIDWLVNNGSTPSGSTGPANDHTTGNSNGHYLYLEASGNCTNMEALLLSPCFDLTSAITPRLTFWYHMYGVDMGELHVDVISSNQVVNDIITPLTGDHGNFWIKDSADLTQFVGQTIVIRFRGITGNDYRSDMALDDISVIDPSTGIGEHATLTNFTVYPNPGTGIFNYNMVHPSTINSISVYDALGKEVYFKSIGRGNMQNGTLDLTTLPAGIYTITFDSEYQSDKIRITKTN